MSSDRRYSVIETKLAIAEDVDYLQQQCRGLFPSRAEARSAAARCFYEKLRHVKGGERSCEKVCLPEETPDCPLMVLQECDGPEYRWAVLEIPDPK